MHFDKNAIIAGVPAKQLRDSLRRLQGGSPQSRNTVCQILGVGDREFDALISADIVEASEELQGHYQLGRRGADLLNAKFVKRIGRAKVDELMEGLLRRAREINDDDRYVMMVVELRLFGSVLNDPHGKDFGDIDVGFRLEKKPAFAGLRHSELHRMTRRNFPEQSFSSQFDAHRDVVLRKLKNRSPYISLHSPYDLEEIETTFQTLDLDAPWGGISGAD
ncbi:hypothetical protein RFM99_00600 [Mesorhizobium sp. VK4C]|uniref:hypothetical protein n=1 Tax=Mesorhizobium captivum TaxID=3072319 RepID=UPI002A24BF50|nr:hypothetical protein [Mesorhizobium sp. VK4C]MDX8496906.1 hypothetical protein [Mesorhizobium sp. VK4C]